MLVLVLATALVQVVWTLALLWPMDAAQTKERAEVEDLRGELGDFALLLIMVGSLTVIGILLFNGGPSKVLNAGLALAAIASVWMMLHSIYTARYARAYYRGTDGGIDFNTSEPPCYKDFYYFSFNLGMTYQVSDTNVTSTALRTEILRHCLYSYVYGTGIIAVTINLVMNVVS
ncbi:DUF1345 domain-containing protein [Propioniciclava coleopterorum]|uniref:DUF1345 domain-containing protein n=1 Tax=Propioniciclava coleopterorum TaxID=2714937 RepID=UPI003D70E9DE